MFKIAVTFEDTQAVTGFIGIGDYLNGNHYAGFLVQNNVIYGTIHDGSGTNTTTTGVTINNGDHVFFLAVYHSTTHTIDF